MPKLPRVSGTEAIRAFERMGFRQVRQQGSHVTMKKGSVGCTIPLHAELATGTLRAILRQANVTPDEFIAHLS